MSSSWYKSQMTWPSCRSEYIPEGDDAVGSKEILEIVKSVAPVL